MNNVDSSSGQR